MTIQQSKIQGWWEVQPLGEVCSIKRGGSPRPIDDFITTDSAGVPWLRIGDLLDDSKYVIATSEKIKREGVSMSTLVNAGDFILSNSMSFGRPYIMKIKACIHDGWLALQNIDKKLSREYLYYYLLSEVSQSQIQALAAGSGVRNLNKELASTILIAIPTHSEQQKIVEVLECWDRGIETTKKLIAEKEKQKRALMQNLLTGKIRLKGFKDKWETKKIGDICNFISGFSFSSDIFIANGTRLIRISNIVDAQVKRLNDDVFLSEDCYGGYKRFAIFKNDLLIAMSGATTGKMGINNLNDKMLLNQRVGIIRAKNDISQIFINACMFMFNNRIIKMAYGAAQPNISSRDIENICIEIPSSLTEQNAIAEVLSSSDKEIDLLTQKLTKLQEQKKGLMQVLLTGQVRLKI